jgi:hypothetical protein
VTEEDTEPDHQPIDDPESYINQRRLKTLFDLRQEIYELRKKVNFASHENEYAALSAYRSGVASYFMEIESLMRKYDHSKELVEDHQFGVITLQVPHRTAKSGRGKPGIEVHLPKANDRRSDPWTRVAELPDPVVIEVKGLESVIEYLDPLTYTFTVEKYRNTRSNDEYQREVKQQIPFEILDSMVREMNNFLADIGLEARLEEQEDPLKL